MDEAVRREIPFRRTALWVVATAAAVYAGLTAIGVRFMLSHENEIAQTILDQHLGTGVDQAPFQGGPNTGADQGGPVAPVAAPVASEHLRVTITP